MPTRKIEIAPGVIVEVNDNPVDAHRFFPEDRDGDPLHRRVPEKQPVAAKARTPQNKSRAASGKAAESDDA